MNYLGQINQSCSVNFDYKVGEKTQGSVDDVCDEPRESGGCREVKDLGVAG